MAVAYGPDPREALIETLQRELEGRNREIYRLHDGVGQQAQAIERTTAAVSAGPASLLHHHHPSNQNLAAGSRSG